MTGCYGNDLEDRHFENELLKHTDPLCECGGSYDLCNCEDEDIEE